jgi:chemotaxis protein MotB
MEPDSPIIIKRINKGSHAAHGGAWKVAYADFVTAMMAFFLLLWLLAATPAENLQGLADYFSPTMGLKDRMGIGFRGGKGVVPDGIGADDWASQGLIFGAPPSGPVVRLDDMTESSGDGGESSDATRFSLLQADLEDATVTDSNIREHINIRVSTEGLVIEIVDKRNKAMFKAGSAELRPAMKKILGIIAKQIRYIPNYISIEGHTNSIRFAASMRKYSNWELSADRANASRRFLVNSGMDKEQVLRVVAKSDQEPKNRNDLTAAENRRISITLLRQSVVP